MSYRVPVPPVPPAVFVFDPATGSLVSHSSSAADLLDKLCGPPANSATLSTVERTLTAGGRIVVVPGDAGGVRDANHELRRLCYRPDGSEFALTRVWSPGTNTILIASDITQSSQDRRRIRFGQLIVDRFMRAPTFDAALSILLRATSLYTGWAHSEVWLPQDDGRTLRRIFSRGGAGIPVGPDGAEQPSCGRDDGVAGEAWWTGRAVSRHCADDPRMDAAVPLRANEEVVAVLTFVAYRARPSDSAMLNLLDGMSGRLGMALKCRLNAERRNIAPAHRDAKPAAHCITYDI